MSCGDIKPLENSVCGDMPRAIRLMKVKPYVYEIVNGKKKRVSPFVMSEDGTTIIEIKQRAIIGFL